MTDDSTADAPRRRGVSPFGFLRPVAGLAVAYAVVTLLWVAFGDALPGGRWLAVHLFTLGVLSNLITALTHHFAETVMHAPSDGRRAARVVMLNVGVVMVLVGLPTAQPVLVAAGATIATAAVFWLYLALRRMRKRSLTGRFAFVVRGYERASGAFIHGAILGALLGIGVLGGSWYGAARLAHLHINVLGWGGLTLLSTIVFFGPTILRTRMEQGADGVAARWIGLGATGLTVAALALLATGAGGVAAVAARVLAVAGLVVYALAATKVCLPVLRAGRRARTSPHGRLLLAAAGWFVLGAWGTALVAALDTPRYYDALGLLLLVGVLGQAIVASLGYLAPMVYGRDPDRRTQIRTFLDRLPTARPAAYNLGVALILAAAVAGTRADGLGAGAIRAGWLLIAAALVVQAGLAAGSMVLQPKDDGPVSSRPTAR